MKPGKPLALSAKSAAAFPEKRCLFSPKAQHRPARLRGNGIVFVPLLSDMITLSDPTGCCGCGACASACPHEAISLREDAEGFLYPHTDADRCTRCGLCEKVCPLLGGPAAARPPLHAYAAHNKSDTQRGQSSSGGIFSLLAEEVTAGGGAVFGARFSRDCRSVCHDYTEVPECIAPFRGSKYVQSRTGSAFRQVQALLRAGRTVLFTGTPCQVAGLRRFLRKDYPRLFTAECLCHGVPSPKVWRRYVDEIFPAGQEAGGAEGKEELRSVNFRDKGHGWKDYRVVLRSAPSGDPASCRTLIEESHHRNPYMRAFLSNLCLRPSCYACRLKNGRSGSDLTLGDFWGIDRISPALDDDRGCTLLLVNTPRGEALCERIAPRMERTEADLEKAKPYNGGFSESIPVPSRRRSFFLGLETRLPLPRLLRTVETTPHHLLPLKIRLARFFPRLATKYF